MLNTLVQMFEWVGLYKNLGNIKATTCTPRFIWGQPGKDAYIWQVTSDGATF